MILMMSSGTPYWEPSECNDIDNKPKILSPKEIMEARLPLDIIANRSTALWDFPFMQTGGKGGTGNLLEYYSKVAPISGQVLLGIGQAFVLNSVIMILYALESDGFGRVQV